MTAQMIVDKQYELLVVADESETLTEVASRMRFNDVGSAVVCDRTGIVGIVTERDVTRATADGADPRRATVGDYMTPDPVIVSPDVDVLETARIMLETGVRHLPVVAEGKLVGLVSVRDLLEQLIW